MAATQSFQAVESRVLDAAPEGAVRGGSYAQRFLYCHHGYDVRKPRSLLTHALKSGSGTAGAVAVTAEREVSLAERARQAAAEAKQNADSGEGCVDLGYPRNLLELYNVGKMLGKGGNGVVNLVHHKVTGETFACKTLPKKIQEEAGRVSEQKVQRHLEAVKSEIEVMRRLRGTLNVAYLEQVFEDEDNVHIIMEHCRGGELLHTIGQKNYSEQTVASIMRAVLRTLAQCHSHHILHLDVKPGNFMLLDESDTAPLKAIDFGLSRPFDPKDVPLSDVGLEGTPWYMAPEMLRSEVTPACDVWAAGVMVYQLLTGYFPFDDKKNPMRPSVNAIWKSILVDKLNFKKPVWDDISDDAKDFVKQLLSKDPKDRPTAKEALKHPWLSGGSVEDRFSPKAKGLKSEVVQRIQRYGQSSVVKRTLLDSLVSEMLESNTEEVHKMCPPSPGVVTTPDCNEALRSLKQHLELAGEGQPVDYATMERLLVTLGYRLHPEEVEHLMETMDVGRHGRVAISQFLASQMDWPAVQKYHKDCFQSAARRAFNNMDVDGDGVVSSDELCNVLRNRLPADEVAPAMEEAMREVETCGCATGSGKVDFQGFMSLLKCGSQDSLMDLSMYDEKLSSCGSSASLDGLLAELERSIREGTLHNSDEWKELERTVKDRNLHNTAEWKELERSVKGASALSHLFGPSASSGSQAVY
uniref:Calcium-dependent protein kinase n=2 Tax=Tetraselmis sp. GSL018 TaxID=582737 RepID=A0A061R2T4_9CHLO